MTAAKHAAKCIAAMDQRANDGLLDITPLLAVEMTVSRVTGGKNKTSKVDAWDATDKEFIAYIGRRLQADRGERRLGFRLLILAACELLDTAEAMDDD